MGQIIWDVGKTICHCRMLASKGAVFYKPLCFYGKLFNVKNVNVNSISETWA